MRKRVKKWDDFRSKAIEAYQNMPLSGTPEDLLQAFKNVPPQSAAIYGFPLGEAIPIECSDPKKRRIEFYRDLCFALKKRFGEPQDSHAHHFMIVDKEDLNPCFFVDVSYGTKKAVYFRIRLQLHFDDTLRNDSLLIYPRASIYHEKIASVFTTKLLWPIAIGTIVGTYFFWPLPFLLLSIRGFFWFVRKASGVKKLSPRDVKSWEATPGSQLESFPLKVSYAEQWKREQLRDVDLAIQDAMSGSSGGGLNAAGIERRSLPSGSAPI